MEDIGSVLIITAFFIVIGYISKLFGEHAEEKAANKEIFKFWYKDMKQFKDK